MLQYENDFWENSKFVQHKDTAEKYVTVLYFWTSDENGIVTFRFLRNPSAIWNAIFSTAEYLVFGFYNNKNRVTPETSDCVGDPSAH